MWTRRKFSKSLMGGGSALLTTATSDGFQSQPPSPPPSAEQQRLGLNHGGRTAFSSGFSAGQDIDLLIKGGTVIDPSQHLHAEMDVAIKNGKILELSKDIPENRARGVLSAKTRIVTPGWIDLHTHCFDVDGYTVCRGADHYCLTRGVTTCVDCGSTGVATIGPFVKYVIPASVTRIYPLLHMGTGNATAPTTELTHHYRYGGRDLEFVNPELTVKAVAEHRPPVVGIKVHLGEGAYDNVKDNEWRLLEMTAKTAEACQLPFMVHAIACYYSTAQILKLFRKGDILTHCYHSYGLPNVILDGNGRILPEVRDARQRGVWFDTGDAHKEVDFDYIERALQQDFLPDSISTNLHADAEYDLVYDLATQVSRYMALGISLDKAIELVTSNPAQVFNYGVQIGTLRPGSEADVSVFELHEGKFVFSDGRDKKRTGHQMLVNTHVVCRGRLFSNKSVNFPTDPPWMYTASRKKQQV